MGELVACVDYGSTFTKAALVDPVDGRLVATAQHRTTLDADVLDGWAACRAALMEQDPRAASAQVRACSSAGGGLRIAVVGNEALITSEAGRRVALSSGGRVVHVAATLRDASSLGGPRGGDEGAVSKGSSGQAGWSTEELTASRPDVVLLVGGTDGGNSEPLLASARALSGCRFPVVVAGDVEAGEQVADLLATAGTPYELADNVVPRIGVLVPGSARAAIREMFLRHVIGGKDLSRSPAFAAMVQGATPDVVLTAVELLATDVGDLTVVDVGGATTDVYSAVALDEVDAQAELSREVVAPTPLRRTVEGDLGMRWSAASTVAAAEEAGLVQPGRLRWVAEMREDPGYLPTDEAARADDLEIAGLAVGLALRRHAGRAQVTYSNGGRLVERTGRDLRTVELVVASGGVLRHAGAAAGETVTRHLGGGWQLPDAPRVVVDTDYVLAPAGLLAADHPEAARGLLSALHGH